MKDELLQILDPAKPTKPTKAQSGRPPFHVRIDAPRLSARDRKRLEKEILGLALDEFALHQSQSGHRPPRRPNGPKILVSLAGGGSVYRAMYDLESRILKRVEEVVDKYEEEQGGGDTGTQSSALSGGSICICMGGTLGREQSLKDQDPLPTPSAPGKPVVIAWYALNSWGDLVEDVIRITILDGAPFGVSNTQVRVGLSLDPMVTWAKEVSAWGICAGKVVTIRSTGAPVWAVIEQAPCPDGPDTVVFSKPKFLGIWTDMHTLDSQRFWPLFAGKSVLFTWVADVAFPYKPGMLF